MSGETDALVRLLQSNSETEEKLFDLQKKYDDLAAKVSEFIKKVNEGEDF